MAANPEELFPLNPPPVVQPPTGIGMPEPIAPPPGLDAGFLGTPLPTAPTVPTAPTAPVTATAPTSGTAPSAAIPALPTDPVQPVLRTIDPVKETVQGQLAELFDKGNPLMVQAREGAQRLAAGRGLQNSTMANQAGEQALFSSALPIAAQDASTYFAGATENQRTQNAFGLAMQQGQISSSLSQQEFGQQIELAKQKFGFDTAMSSQDALQRLTELAAQGDQQARLALLNFGYETNLTTLRGHIARDQANSDFANRLIELAKSGDVQAMLQAQQFGFNISLSAQDNMARLQQIAATGDANAALQLQQFQFQSLLNDQAAGIQLQLEDQRFQNTQNTVLLEYAQRGILTTQEAQQQMERLNQQHANTLEQIAAQVTASTSADAAAAGRALQSNYLVSVADRQRQGSEEIAQIYQTEGLTSAQQNTAVANAYARMTNDINLLSAFYARSPLWDTNWGATAPVPPVDTTTGGEGITPPGTTPPGIPPPETRDLYERRPYEDLIP